MCLTYASFPFSLSLSLSCGFLFFSFLLPLLFSPFYPGFPFDSIIVPSHILFSPHHRTSSVHKVIRDFCPPDRRPSLPFSYFHPSYIFLIFSRLSFILFSSLFFFLLFSLFFFLFLFFFCRQVHHSLFYTHTHTHTLSQQNRGRVSICLCHSCRLLHLVFSRSLGSLNANQTTTA